MLYQTRNAVVCLRSLIALQTAWSWIGGTVSIGALLLAGALAPLDDAERVNGSLIYDFNPETSVGDEIFGDLIADLENNGERNSHGGPVCIQYPNGDLVAFHTNCSGHNIDGWTEYAISRDGGKTWDRQNKFGYSYEAYQEDPKSPVWVESALVTKRGTVILFVTKFEQFDSSYRRVEVGTMRSNDNGQTWSDYRPIEGMVGYPSQVAVDGETLYCLVDPRSESERHELHFSTDDGRTWEQRSKLTVRPDSSYGALCVMADGRVMAGAYVPDDQDYFYYCISGDNGRSWGNQQKAKVNKQLSNPMLAYVDGRYYLHGRSGNQSFVLYQSENGEDWDEGTYISDQPWGLDSYSYNSVIRREGGPLELMVLYSIAYTPRNTNSYVFYIRPDKGGVE